MTSPPSDPEGREGPSRTDRVIFAYIRPTRRPTPEPGGPTVSEQNLPADRHVGDQRPQHSLSLKLRGRQVVDRDKPKV